MSFFDFHALGKQQTELWRDITVDSLDGCQMRMLKLNALQLLPILGMRDEFKKNKDGTLANDADTIAFAVALVSKAAANDKNELQFDSEEGRAYLAPSMALFEMFPVAAELCKISAKPDAKKNGRARRTRTNSVSR